MRLGEYLESYTVEILKPLAAFCADRPPIRKNELVDCIAQTLSSPTEQRHQWQQLDDLSRKALAQAVHSGGEFDPAAFVARHGQLPPRPGTQYSWQRKPIRLDLFLHNNRVPDDLLPLLEPWVPRPDPYKVEGQLQVPDTVRVRGRASALRRADTEHTGPQDLAAFLRLAESGKVQISTTTHMPTGAALARVLSVLHEGDFLPPLENAKATQTIRPVGLIAFAIGAGLIEGPRLLGSGKPTLTKAGRTWLQTQEPALLLEAFERWGQSDKHDELARIRAIKGRSSTRTRLTPPSLRRERVIEALSWCPVGVWIDVEQFFRAILIWQFDFEVEATPGRGLYVGYSRDNGWMSASAYWRIMKGLYILAVLWEGLATLGALDIAYLLPEDADYEADTYGYDEGHYSLYDGLRYFRINDLGAYLLGQHDEYAPFSQPRPRFLRIDPDLVVHITSPEQVAQSDRLALQAIATPLDEHRYRIELERLLTALAEERDLQASLDYLTRWHDGPVPKELTALFADAHRRGKAFAAPRSAFTIEAHDPELARLVLEDAHLKRFGRLAGDRTIVVPGNREQAFRKRLRELGYVLPKK